MTLLFLRPYLAKAYKVARFDTATELFLTPSAAKNLQSAALTNQYANDAKNIAGSIEHILSVLEGGELSLNSLGWDVTVMAIWTNMTSALSGSGAGAGRRLTIPHDNAPYVGLIVQYPIDGGGDVHIGFVRCKTQSAFDIEVGESAEFSVPEMSVKFGRLRKSNDTLVNAFVVDAHATEIPITDNFNTFFGLA